MNTQQLRQKILDLAIRGQLVPQDENDEPAQVLLEKIRTEKEKNLSKKGKPSSTSPYQNEQYFPFQIPENWVWCRLGEIGEIISGGTPSTSNDDYWNGEIPWITPADLSGYTDKYISKGKRNISLKGLENSSAKKISKGSVLFSSRAPIGYVVISKNELTTNQGFKSVSPYIQGMEVYIYYFLLAQKENISLRASGTTFKEISGTEFGKTLISLPPLKEQVRIVSKIEEVFAVIDTIEQNQSDLKTTIEKTKAKVLDMAIRGELLNDENRGLETLDNEHYTDEEFPFPIPKHWQWKKLGEVCEFIKNGITIKQNKELKGFPITRIETISNGIIDRSRMGYAGIFGINDYQNHILKEGDILLSHINSPIHIGKSAIYTPLNKEEKIIHGMNLLRLRLKNENPFYVNYFFTSKIFRDFIHPYIKNAVNQASINIGNMNKISIPLPPPEEQQKIVKKIEKIFSELDKIETFIN